MRLGGHRRSEVTDYVIQPKPTLPRADGEDFGKLCHEYQETFQSGRAGPVKSRVHEASCSDHEAVAPGCIRHVEPVGFQISDNAVLLCGAAERVVVEDVDEQSANEQLH
ncbi:hypothetical protein HPB50_009170 [Hyalomma asiaticum]|uniref:Uncharacterized protein n=1 Tax=Hyalomma asiaticum TaxID=266040 RepID=A0ACB7SU87_HYAAI|nr:hypothetical protein HPB50_009170 [Hyalomma asiaticum]